jgi:hypothetical protein
MAAPALSGKILPTGFAVSYLKVMVDLLGRHGTDAVLRRAGLESWIGRADPALASEAMDFAQASALLGGLEETLGARGGRGLARRMGAAAFDHVLRPVGAVAAMRDPGFQAFPLDRRLRAGMYGLARSLGQITSTLVTTREQDGAVVFRLDACPDCWARSSKTPACTPMIGMLSAAAAWIAPEAETRIVESACRAQGAAACEFIIRWEPAE